MSTLDIHTEPNELAVVETVQQLTASETVQELSIQLSDNELTLDETIQVLDITNDVPTLDLTVNQLTLEGQLEPLVINQGGGSGGSFSLTEFIKASLETVFLVFPGGAYSEPVHTLINDGIASDVLNGGQAAGGLLPVFFNDGDILTGGSANG